jgi:hypothetical protein
MFTFRKPKSSNKKKNSPPKKVSFTGDVTILEFPFILGDNPSCSKGAPLTIGWRPIKKTTRSLDMLEMSRAHTRRPRKALAMSEDRRETILKNAGYEKSEIRRAVDDAQTTRRQRRETIEELGVDKLADALESNAGGILPKGIMKNVLAGTRKTFNLLSPKGSMKKKASAPLYTIKARTT